MYGRNWVNTRMELWGTGYYGGKTKINSQPEIPYDVSFWKRPTCQTLSKPLDISSATVIYQVTELSKAIVILSDTTVRRSKIGREDMKP